MLFMGIDVGTQGVRCAVVDEQGRVAAAQSIPFRALNAAEVEGWYEQRPEDWQSAAEAAIQGCVSQLSTQGLSAEAIRAISIDGTSGTLVPLDGAHQPLCRGIMYNDPRAGAQAAQVHAALGEQEARLGYRFGASFSLSRILWLAQERPEIYEKAAVFAHQADYVAGLLCGEFAVSDTSNALKTGFDPIHMRWPEAIESALGLNLARFPRVLRPGEPIARVTPRAAERLGLHPRTWVVGGSTDGTASALAVGAVRAGCWASIIGTTFVLKGVTPKLILDPAGASYSHRLPSGEWLLGGASNVGGRALNAAADGRPFAELDAEAGARVPTGVRCYPLTGRGERFPWVDARCMPFYVGDVTGARLYPAVMEGVGFVERLSLERMAALGCPVGDSVRTAGGACRSDLWLRLRASILNKPLRVPAVAEAAMGSALLAASHGMGGLSPAADAMIRWEKTVEPERALAERYDELYHLFLQDVRNNHHWQI